MTVGELRKALEGVADDLEVLIDHKGYLFDTYIEHTKIVHSIFSDEPPLGIGEYSNEVLTYFVIS